MNTNEQKNSNMTIEEMAVQFAVAMLSNPNLFNDCRYIDISAPQLVQTSIEMAKLMKKNLNESSETECIFD